jgi:arsenate reductase
MGQQIFNVLFLCTGNSARSILAEAILAKEGRGRFRSFSAGSRPAGKVNPIALQLLKELGHDTTGFRSKNWDEFAGSDAPEMHFIITVCDNAAGEVCPVWPGYPTSAHWGIPDPAAVEGSGTRKMQAFVEAHQRMHDRIAALLDLPLAAVDRLTVQARLNDIGAARGQDQ